MQSQLSVAISDFKNSINKLASHFPSEQTAFNAILEAVGGASKWSLPDDKRYISKDKRKLLAIQWSNNGENISDEDYEAGYDCYAIGDLYNLPEGFDVSTLPKGNYELDKWDYSGPQPVYKGLDLEANLTQMLYKSSEPQPSEAKVVEDIMGTPQAQFAAEWDPLPCE